MKTVLASVAKIYRAITVEVCWLTGRWGGGIVARIVADGFDLLDAPVLRVGGEGVSMPYNRELEKSAIPGRQSRQTSSGIILMKNGKRRS
jgi:pyruvate/2-oxoglutarate/acetoin dehydrogenase E1 component